MNVGLLNALAPKDAQEALLKCCGSSVWTHDMVQRRPFKDRDHLFKCADEAYDQLSNEDWLEAFRHHPKIGDVNALRKKFSTQEWSKGEQAGVNSASEEVLNELAAGNEDYERKFGFIFIVCASGKSAVEMLQLLKQRITNDPAAEIKIASAENRKIMKIRLEKLCSEVQSPHMS